MRHKRCSPRWEMGKRLTRQPSLRTLAQVGCRFDPWIFSPVSLITGNMGTHLIITGCFDVPPMAGRLYSMWTDTHICIHTNIYMCTYAFSGRSVASVQVARWWVGFGNCAVTQKFTHHRQGQAHLSPLLHSASALQIRRQTANESSCKWTNYSASSLPVLLLHLLKSAPLRIWLQFQGGYKGVSRRCVSGQMQSQKIFQCTVRLLSLSPFLIVYMICCEYFLSLLNGC